MVGCVARVKEVAELLKNHISLRQIANELNSRQSSLLHEVEDCISRKIK